MSADRDLGAGWHHGAAVRQGPRLVLSVDGKRVASSDWARPLDVTCEQPLRIGFGPQGHLQGKLQDLRLYSRALDAEDVRALASECP